MNCNGLAVDGVAGVTFRGKNRFAEMNTLEGRQDIGYCYIADDDDPDDGTAVAAAAAGVAGDVDSADGGMFVAVDIAVDDDEIGAMVEHAREEEREQSLSVGKTVMIVEYFGLHAVAEMETCRLTGQIGG